ncbi:CHAT domain-containing protein [Amycolatopsis sp. WAC 04182]|uniref:CHAT domain-containing protein n=1 Tax=Amycolatopsis sp. WAC 04182 TaxID=2203198 RepID=UPI0013152F85|nr:CHAT domain-containing protein [Amycolatopsis sp. WAC 04182]
MGISLLERILRCLETSESDEVTTPEAVADAARLVLPAIGTGLPPELLRQLGMLHWLRHCALPPGGIGPDIQICTELFAPLAESFPGVVPPPVLGWLRENHYAGLTPAQLGPFYASVITDAALTAADPVLTDLGIAACRAAVDAGGEVDRPAHLFNLMTLANQRFEWTAAEADLDDAVAAGRAALESAEHPIAPAVRFPLGLALLTRFGIRGRERDLADSTVLLREVASSLPLGDPDRVACLSQLALALETHCNIGGPLAVVEEYVEVTREVLASCAPDDPAFGEALLLRGSALRVRFVRTGDATDIAESVRYLREALGNLPEGSESHVPALLNLASSLQTRFSYASAFTTPDGPDEADLAEAITLARKADAALGETHPLRWAVEATLATVLRAEGTDPAEVTRAARAALAALPADSPLRGTALLSLGEALRRLYRASGGQEVLREAVDVLREAKTAGAGGPLGRTPMLTALSMVLYEAVKLADTDGEIDDGELDEAIETTRTAARDIPDDTVIRGQQLWQLAELLRWRFLRTGQATNLDERIETLRATVPLAPDAPALTQCLSALVDALSLRYSRNPDPSDLDESVAALCRIVESLPADDPRLPDLQADTAWAHLQRFDARGEPADRETATRLIRSALAATGDSSRYRILGVLAAILSSTATSERDPEKLTEAIEACHAATPPGAVPKVAVTLTLGNALMSRYENTGAEADLEAAAKTLRSALAHATEMNRVMLVNNLIQVLRIRFFRHGDRSALAEAIDRGKAALRESPDALLLAGNVAAAQTDRYEWARDSADLTEAVDALRSVLGRARPDSPDLPTFRFYLGHALRARFQATASIADLDEAIAVLRPGLASVRSRDQKVQFSLMLGIALSLHGQWSNDQVALAEASELLRVAAGGLPVASPGRNTAGIFLASTLRLRFLNSGEDILLAEAIEIGRDVLARTQDEEANRAYALITLGTLLALRFERTGDVGVLTESIEVLRRGVAAAGPNDAITANALSELAHALRGRFSILAESADLNEAIEAAERATTLPGTTPAERSAQFTALAVGLLTRSLATGDLDDLDAAVDLGREAARAPNWHVASAINLMTLGLALWSRFDRTGTVSDLNAAIDALFEAAEDAHPGHIMRPIMLTNLSNALRTRAGLLGSVADLDAAVEAGRSAVAAAPADHPAVPMCLMNLGTALHLRYLEKQDTADLDAAVAALNEAVDRSTPQSPNRREILINLAGLLRTRRDRRPSRDALDRAVALVREAIAITDVTHSMYPLCVLSLSTVLHTRYDRGGDDADAAESIESARRAIDRLTAGDPRVAVAWVTLGRLHERRRVEGRRDVDAAVAAYRTAVESPAAAPTYRAAAARLWAETAVRHRDWTSATEAFGVAVALLPNVAWHGIERDARERRLTMWEGLARVAAAAALEAGDPGRAVELLEQGRSVLWSQALQTRDDLSMLRERDRALHDRLRAVAAKLAATTAPEIPEAAATTDPWSDPSQRMQSDRIKLAEDWDRLLAEARALPGLEYLLRIPPLATLREGLPDGPVVLLNVDEARCDALIVHGDRDVDHVPLPDLSYAEAGRQAEGYLRALKLLENPGGPGDLATTGAKQTVHATLEWLWDTVAEPVLTRLGYTGHDEPLPRLWWCPTGSLTLLPLHAVGYHDPADTPAGRTVIDRVVSSYTPTLRALAKANTASAVKPADRRILVVSMPETPPVPGSPAMCPLPGARAEAEFVSRAPSFNGTVRVADTATHAATTADLRTHAYAHFACHGGQNLRQPSTGSLYLWDKPLSVLEVAELDLEHAELAYLSACSTAIGGTDLPDEAIHLAAALQLAGYRQVIATLWTITDRTAVEVAETMYTGLLGPSGLRLDDTAHLLHRTVRALRDSAPRNPAIWAPYVHFGP